MSKIGIDERWWPTTLFARCRQTWQRDMPDTIGAELHDVEQVTAIETARRSGKFAELY